ncbi:hypothetical protein WKI65_31570 [Streptomyces sp. MS1.AVA.3]|uniref:hypothetical protein n=1 Tax=Streptomyces decoyicus TaxID=249567 RepID=UPI0030BBADFA
MKDGASRQADDGESGPTPFVVDPVDEKLDAGEREGMGLPHPGYTSPDFSSPGSLPSSSSAEQGGGQDAADPAGGDGNTGGTAGAGSTAGAGGAGGETSSDASGQRVTADDAADEDAVPGFSAPDFTSPGFDSPDIPTGPQLGETETGRRMRAEQQGEDAVTPVPLPEAHRPPQPPPRRG